MNSVINKLKLTLTVSTLVVAGYSYAKVDGYDYPITDRFAATVVGTPAAFAADLPEKIPFAKKTITIFPERKTPDVLWYGKELIYSAALQEQAAPLMFLIAGTGAAHDGSKNYDMARAFYQAGFHVISLSSPTIPNFVIAASSTGVVGHAERDAEDIYRVMTAIWSRLGRKNTATSFNLTGYSLGGFNAAFVAKLDEERKFFNFARVLMINPPLSLYNSISLLDRMTENIPGGVDNFDKFFDQLMLGITKIYGNSGDVVNDDFLYQAYQALGLKDEQLAALIGTSFRISSASQVFSSDVMADFGYIKPRGLILNRQSDLTLYDGLASRLSLTDYYHEFFYPYYLEEFPDKTRDEVISAISLHKIEDYLRDSDKIWVTHNSDDIILEPGEIDFFHDVFGDRATIYPYGGHLGNINHRDNVAHMLEIFTRTDRSR